LLYLLHLLQEAVEQLGSKKASENTRKAEEAEFGDLEFPNPRESRDMLRGYAYRLTHNA